MLKYILKRILIFIPTLIVISLLTFFISLNAPGDPVEFMLGGSGAEGQLADKLATEETYLRKRKELGLDLPIFYFSISRLSYSDTLYRIPKKLHKENLERLIDQYGNWPQIADYFKTLQSLDIQQFQIEKDSANAEGLIPLGNHIGSLFYDYEDPLIRTNLRALDSLVRHYPSFSSISDDVNQLQKDYNDITEKATVWKNYVPTIHIYGFKNQYHRWFINFITGDFGISYVDKRPISSILPERLFWTMILSVLSIILTYIIAIPIGVYSALQKGSRKDQAITTVLFMLYSLPNFWIGTLLIIYIGGSGILPIYGLGDLPEDASTWDTVLTRAEHLILPLICWTYGSFAFLSRQMRGGMLAVLGQDYIRTARAKGLNPKNVTWKHAFRNSLLPIITLFANVFPLMIGGSVVIEMLFTIPGMGFWALKSITLQDYPVIFTVMMFSAILTMVGYLVADILYAVVDPRITYGGKK